MVCVPTTGTHLFSPLTNSYSTPSSVSSTHLSSSLEKEIRGSPSKSDGDWGKPDSAVSRGLLASSIVSTSMKKIRGPESKRRNLPITALKGLSEFGQHVIEDGCP